MALFEPLINIFAPHDCLVCGREGDLLCRGCMQQLPDTNQGHYLSGLAVNSNLLSVRARTFYSGPAKDLIHKLKFERASAAAQTIANSLVDLVPANFDGLIVPVPTAAQRVRQRGYNQANLIAKSLAYKSGLSFCPALSRSDNSRQIGANRSTRLEQLKKSFYSTKPVAIRNRHILLVDDVVTTGSTLESAAACLQLAGSGPVEAIVFAQA